MGSSGVILISLYHVVRTVYDSQSIPVRIQHGFRFFLVLTKNTFYKSLNTLRVTGYLSYKYVRKSINLIIIWDFQHDCPKTNHLYPIPVSLYYSSTSSSAFKTVLGQNKSPNCIQYVDLNEFSGHTNCHLTHTYQCVCVDPYCHS